MPPVEVHLPIIIDKCSGVDGVAVCAFNRYGTGKGTGWRCALRDAFALAGVAEEKVVAVIVVDAVGRKEGGICPVEAGVGRCSAEAFAVILPVDEIGRREDAVGLSGL